MKTWAACMPCSELLSAGIQTLQHRGSIHHSFAITTMWSVFLYICLWPASGARNNSPCMETYLQDGVIHSTSWSSQIHYNVTSQPACSSTHASKQQCGWHRIKVKHLAPKFLAQAAHWAAAWPTRLPGRNASQVSQTEVSTEEMSLENSSSVQEARNIGHLSHLSLDTSLARLLQFCSICTFWWYQGHREGH